MDRPGRRAAASEPAAVQPAAAKVAVPEPAPEHPELRAAREQAADEARRLREADGLADHERAGLLANLASRLDALVRHLAAQGVAPGAAEPLHDLAAAIEAGGDLEVLWAQALRVLDEFTAGAGAVGSTRAPSRGRRAFWKR